MLSPETVVTINTIITSLPFLAAICVVIKRPARALIQLYSLGYLAPVLAAVYGISVPVPGNLYAYFTGASIILTYGVTDILIVLYSIGSAVAVALMGIDQWADLIYSLSLTVAWLIPRELTPKASLIVGIAITVGSNILIALYKYIVWPIVPLPSVLPEFLTAVSAITAIEGIAWWVLTSLKPPARQR
ncbi:hypothetical protein [Methanopyrus kandleri]